MPISPDLTQRTCAGSEAGLLYPHLVKDPQVEIRQGSILLWIKGNMPLMTKASSGDEDRKIRRAMRGGIAKIARPENGGIGKQRLPPFYGCGQLVQKLPQITRLLVLIESELLNLRSTHPMMRGVVMVEMMRGDYPVAVCTGTVIARNVVLTAAHCFDENLVPGVTSLPHFFLLFLINYSLHYRNLLSPKIELG